jgi:ABC-type dipeptide/oligopeptide/nickel transport system permease subunit
VSQDLSQGRIYEWRHSSQIFDVAYRVLAEKRGQLALFILLILILGAIFSTLISPYHYSEQIRGVRLIPPSWDHPFGTDDLNRDMFVRTLYGLRISLAVSFGAVSVGAITGVTLGYTAGYFGGWVEMIIMRILDTMLAFPGILTAIAVLAILGTGLMEVSLAIGIGAIPVFGRLARGQLLQEKNRDYALAAESLGAKPVRIVLRHIAINTLPPLLVQAALFMSAAVIAEASLNFLGMGASPPIPTIGILLSEARRWLTSGAWWFILFPTLMLSFRLIALNFLADALLEATNPYGRNK